MITKAHTAAGPATAAGRRLPLRRVLSRYTIGSIIAAGVTEATLLLVYGLDVAGPQAASVVAWVVGSLVNYFLKRNWTWGRRGRSHPFKELLPYWLMAVASMAISAWATGLAHRFGDDLFASDGARVVFVGAAFLATYGVLFVAKFLIFHYVLFAQTATPRESR